MIIIQYAIELFWNDITYIINIFYRPSYPASKKRTTLWPDGGPVVLHYFVWHLLIIHVGSWRLTWELLGGVRLKRMVHWIHWIDEFIHSDADTTKVGFINTDTRFYHGGSTDITATPTLSFYMPLFMLMIFKNNPLVHAMLYYGGSTITLIFEGDSGAFLAIASHIGSERFDWRCGNTS